MAIAVGDLNPRPTAAVDSQWRRIVTPIPVPESIPMIERLRAAEPRSMAGMPPIVWHEAEGFLVRDAFGNQWIDLTSGIVVANAGHSHPRILDAIRAAIDQKLLATYAFSSNARLQLVEKLVALSPIPNSKAILFSSGTEATECMISLMRGRGRQINPHKVAILGFTNHYHGRTLGAQLAGGQSLDWIDRERVHYLQMPFPNFQNSCEDKSADALFESFLTHLSERGVDPDQIAGLILEPAPGTTTEPIPRDFGAALAAWARRHDVLIGFDEIQCGCGRTGTFFACEQTGMTPDLIALGKGLTSSLPVSAVLGPADILDQAEPGEMSSTHGGNPVCAAAALANLQVIEEEHLVEASARTGARVRERLRSFADEFPASVRSVNGVGLFISIHFHQPDGQPDVELADALALEAVRSGVLMFTTGRGYLKFTPPLSIDPAAADEAADVIRECFARVTNGEDR
ncbi:MAG: aspartate aminotransferase family protein [Planctomycetaceae bacterium]|nr:aspartate aminotransferase family protein [Planctomycetaceae bacterium]